MTLLDAVPLEMESEILAICSSAAVGLFIESWFLIVLHDGELEDRQPLMLLPSSFIVFTLFLRAQCLMLPEELTLASLPSPLFCRATTAEKAVPLTIGPLKDREWQHRFDETRDEAVGVDDATDVGLRFGVAKLERVTREATVWDSESVIAGCSIFIVFFASFCAREGITSDSWSKDGVGLVTEGFISGVGSWHVNAVFARGNAVRVQSDDSSVSAAVRLYLVCSSDESFGFKTCFSSFITPCPGLFR